MRTTSIACLATLAGVLLGATGCTTEAWYEGMKRRAENDCHREPFGAREACFDRVNKMPYSEYEKQRAGEKP